MAKLQGNINNIYIATEDICKANQYGLIDTILASASVSDLTQDMMIAYLDATLEKKNKLKQREAFYAKCSDELVKRGEKKSTRFEKLN